MVTRDGAQQESRIKNTGIQRLCAKLFDRDLDVDIGVFVERFCSSETIVVAKFSAPVLDSAQAALLELSHQSILACKST